MKEAIPQGDEKVREILKEGEVIVYVWFPIEEDDESYFGHASMQTPNYYVSFWPADSDDESQKSKLRLFSTIKDAHSEGFIFKTDHHEDIEAEGGRRPDRALKLSGLNTRRIDEQFKVFYKNPPNWNIFSNHCTTTIEQLLDAGGIYRHHTEPPFWAYNKLSGQFDIVNCLICYLCLSLLPALIIASTEHDIALISLFSSSLCFLFACCVVAQVAQRGYAYYITSENRKKASYHALKTRTINPGIQPIDLINICTHHTQVEEFESVHKTVSIEFHEGLQYQKIPGDGHCLFHTVGLYLGEDQDFLRRIVATHLAENKEDYQDFYSSPKKSLEAHIEAIREGLEWGDHLEIQILQKLTDRPVIVFRSDALPTIPEDYDEYEKTPIFVYYNGRDHYDALILREGYKAEDILSDILSDDYSLQRFKLGGVTQLYEHSQEFNQSLSSEEEGCSTYNYLEV